MTSIGKILIITSLIILSSILYLYWQSASEQNEFYSLVENNASISMLTEKFGEPIKSDSGENLSGLLASEVVEAKSIGAVKFYYWAPRVTSPVYYIAVDDSEHIIKYGHVGLD